jgi:hypothetical protein
LLGGCLAPEVPPLPFFAGGCGFGVGLGAFCLGGHLWNKKHVEDVAMETWAASLQRTMTSMCE